MEKTTIADMISAETIAALYAACPFPVIKQETIKWIEH